MWVNVFNYHFCFVLLHDDDTSWCLIVPHFKWVFCKIVSLNPRFSNTDALAWSSSPLTQSICFLTNQQNQKCYRRSRNCPTHHSLKNSGADGKSMMQLTGPWNCHPGRTEVVAFVLTPQQSIANRCQGHIWSAAWQWGSNHLSKCLYTFAALLWAVHFALRVPTHCKVTAHTQSIGTDTDKIPWNNYALIPSQT